MDYPLRHFRRRFYKTRSGLMTFTSGELRALRHHLKRYEELRVLFVVLCIILAFMVWSQKPSPPGAIIVACVNGEPRVRWVDPGDNKEEALQAFLQDVKEKRIPVYRIKYEIFTWGKRP